MSEPRPKPTSALDAPQADGEQMVSWLRLFLAFAMIGVQLSYFNMISPPVWKALTVSIVLDSVWAILAVAYLVFARKERYRPWISYVSTIFDAMIVFTMQLAVTSELPLSFTNGPIKYISFVMIGLAALRRSSRLVLASGVMAAATHLMVSAMGFVEFAPGSRLVSVVNGHEFELTFMDEIGFAIILVVVGWLTGAVTRNLRQSERHYHDLFEHIPDGIVITSMDRNILAVNRRFSDMSGFAKEALIGRDIRTLLESPVQGRVSLTPSLLEAPTSLIRATKEEIPVRTVTVPIRYQGTTCFETSFRDVTEHVRLERQLARSQKMETIGKLAGGLAHDFNNILGGIMGATSLVGRTVSKVGDTSQRARLSSQLKLLQECAEQARNVVGRLLTFSDTSAIETAPVNLETLARDVATICRNTFAPEISIKVVSEDAPLTVMGDATSLSQALLNLCLNARDAMKGRGLLAMEVALVDMEDPILSRHPEADPEEEYCRIGVRDNGIGMSEKTMSKIFDPFYTTKAHGEGTGLGLSMVYNVARQHGGFVDVSSTINEGSCFEIYLTKARESLLPTGASEHILPRGSGRILVMDDDEIVRTTMKGMLEELGYQVNTTVSGRRGLETFLESKDPVDLVLMDISPPKDESSAILDAIRETAPETKIVASSGFADTGSIESLLAAGTTAFLRKPFTFLALAKTVHDALKS